GDPRQTVGVPQGPHQIEAAPVRQAEVGDDEIEGPRLGRGEGLAQRGRGDDVAVQLRQQVPRGPERVYMVIDEKNSAPRTRCLRSFGGGLLRRRWLKQRQREV